MTNTTAVEVMNLVVLAATYVTVILCLTVIIAWYSIEIVDWVKRESLGIRLGCFLGVKPRKVEQLTTELTKDHSVKDWTKVSIEVFFI